MDMVTTAIITSRVRHGATITGNLRTVSYEMSMAQSITNI